MEPNAYLSGRGGVTTRGAWTEGEINTGSCLSIHAQPQASAQVLECAADGVLLTEVEREPASAGGRSWFMVFTPSRQQGWANSEYLER